MWNYSDLINVEEFWDKRDYFEEDRWDISYYCKDCSMLVEVERKNPKWFTFICKTCQWTTISLGTRESLKTRYKIKK